MTFFWEDEVFFVMMIMMMYEDDVDYEVPWLNLNVLVGMFGWMYCIAADYHRPPPLLHCRMMVVVERRSQLYFALLHLVMSMVLA